MNAPIPPAERKIRGQLPFIRFSQSYLPLPAARWLIRQGMAHVRLPAAVRRETLTVDGVPCERLVPVACQTDRALLYLHGGGFVYGLTPLHMEMVARIVGAMNVPALLVDYRLAPDHPFPAALDDCVAAYRWLLEQGIPAGHIGVAGDSAGGNLTLTLLMKLRDGGEALPAAAACLSPVADLSQKGASPAPFADPLLPPKALKLYRTAYVADNDPRQPLISPVFGDWQGLPPLLVHVGEDEILRADAVRIEALARAAGVDVQLDVFPRMWHVWQLYLELPQAVESLDAISRFLSLHLPPVRQPGP